MKHMLKRNPLCVSIQFLFALFSLSHAASPSGFEGGTGQPCDPYQIADAEQLLRIGSDAAFLDKSFILVNDIQLPPKRIFNAALIDCKQDLDSAESLPLVYHPVGDRLVAAFRGTFLGNGHTIRNMVIKAPDRDCVGLFALIGEGAQVCNLRIEASRVEGKRHVGLLAGINFGTISCCSTYGAVSADNRAGGMVGTTKNSLIHCKAFGSVEGKRILGGLAGHAIAKSSITCCYTMTKVSGKSHVGGLVGQMLPGTLTGCFASGSVESESSAGGLVGAGPFGGSIVYCKSSVRVKGVVVGGLTGIAQRTSINNSHVFGSLVKIKPDGQGVIDGLGGIVGYWRGGKGAIISSTWNTDITHAEVAVGRSAPDAAVKLLSTCGQAPCHANKYKTPFRNPFFFRRI